MTANEPMQHDGVLVLEKFARHHKADLVRLGAYQALGLLVDLKGVEALRKDIKMNEKNDYLKDLFDTMP